MHDDQTVADPLRDAEFEQIALLATRLCGVACAFVSASAEACGCRVFAQSGHTGPGGIDLQALAQIVGTTGPQFVVVSDFAQDERFRGIAGQGASGAPRFFARRMLADSEGRAIGMLGVADVLPRSLSADQTESLEILSRQATAHCEFRRGMHQLHRAVEEHQKVEMALRNSEVFYHSLVESLPQNIFRKDLAERFTFANKKFCATLGRPLDQILGKTDFDFFPADLAQKYQRDDKRVLDSLEPFETVEAHTTPSGDKIFVHVMKTPLYDSLDRVIGIQGLFWDVTERKRTEEALAYERDLLRTLLDNLPDAIYFKDSKSRFLKCSRALVKRFGLNHAEDVVGHTDFDYFDANHAEMAYSDEQRIILTGKPIIGKPEMETRSGKEASWVLTTKMPFRNQNGAIIGTFGISKDITELKQAETELALARDKAIELARLKSEFLANMSHEIRTPMNGILGMTDLLLSTTLSPDQRDFAETIRSSADSLLVIVNEILDFSKMEAGKLQIEVVDLVPRDVVEGTLELLAGTAHQKGLEIGCFIDPNVPALLRGDPGRLRQILTNLVGNAMKFTQKGQVLVNVKLAEETESHATLAFSVKDTGIGMRAEAIPRLFNAFTQEDGSVTRRYGGTGLGLAICRQLVDLMHGQISVKSTLGQGSEFRFTVVLEKSSEAPSGKEPDSVLAHHRVLGVAASEISRKSMVQHFDYWRMESQMCGSGSEALTILAAARGSKKPIEIVVIDLELADMDGLKLAALISGAPGVSPEPLPAVILLAPLGYRASSDVLLKLNIRFCLSKPVKQARLGSTLESLLPGAEGPSSVMPTTPEAVASKIGREWRILVAEDNAVNQKVALRQLARLGFAPEVAANGLEAVEAFERQAYDVVFMDCQMPGMDGFEATRRIRILESAVTEGMRKRSPVRIVAMTANAMVQDRQQCLSAGMDDYITKPVMLQDLEAALFRALNPESAAGAQRNFLSGAIPPSIAAEEGLSNCAESASEPSREGSKPKEGSEADSNLPVLDPVVLNGLRGTGDAESTEAFKELVELFVRDSEILLASIQGAIAGAKQGELIKAAHSFKGSSNNMGLRRLAQVCAKLEEAAKRGDSKEGATMLDQITKELDCARLSLWSKLESS